MKSKKILITIIIFIVALLIGTTKVQAASVGIEASKKEVEVGDEITITAKFIAAAWNIKVSGNGISGASYAAQTSDLSEAENVKTFKLDTSKVGTYTVIISGDITDSNGDTKEVSQSCTITVKEKTVTPPPQQEPQPEQTPTPEPETPTVEETPNLTDASKTMYASKDMYLRASWSTESAGTKISKGTELIVTATSNNTVNKYVWYRVTYNGKTFYAASSLLINTKPEEPIEEPKTEEPKEEPTLEEPTIIDATVDTTEAKDGLKSLEIEGITLLPQFTTDVYEYRIILKQDINELIINAVPVLEDATVIIAGNTNLKEGENLITIVVYNVENEVATYQITVNKNTLDLSMADDLLKSGTQSAKRNLTIFILILAVAIIALVVVMILKRKNEEEYEDEYEENYGENGEGSFEFTENEQHVDSEEEIEQIEKQRPRREKRKGKHF